MSGWTFDGQGDLDPAVLVARVEGNASFERVRLRAGVETDADEEKFSRLVPRPPDAARSPSCSSAADYS